MPLAISLSANHKHIDAIRAEVERVKGSIRFEKQVHKGKTPTSTEEPNVAVITHAKEPALKLIYEFILGLEPLIEDVIKKKRKESNNLHVPTPEEILDYGYE